MLGSRLKCKVWLSSLNSGTIPRKVMENNDIYGLEHQGCHNRKEVGSAQREMETQKVPS